MEQNRSIMYRMVYSGILKKAFRLFRTFAIVFALAFIVLNLPVIVAEGRYYLRQLSSDDKKEASFQAGIFDPVEPNAMPVSGRVRNEISRPDPLPNSGRIVIDKLGVDSPLVFGISERPQEVYDNLMRGVVHYGPTNKPGEAGASILLSHSSVYLWQRQPFAASFALINKLKEGDTFSVEYEDGRNFDFTIDRTLIFNPLEGDNEKLLELENTLEPTVVLVTCYPPGQNKNRIAVAGVCTNCQN